MSAANNTQPNFPGAHLSSDQESSAPRIMLCPPYTAYSILLLLLMCSMVYFFRLAWPFSWPSGTSRRSIDLLTATAEDLQQLLTAGELTSVELVDRCFAQIDRHDDCLKAVLQKNPQARTVAAALDLERKNGHLRGPLHGIPILIKDNIATHPSLGMNTTGGSLALLTSRPSKSAEIIERILEAGMIIIGKTQLSELAGFKGSNIMPGWSALGGQTQSAYTIGDSPSDSSTGSAVGVSAGYAPLAIGTDTGGSLITPSTRAALYTLRPTMNLVPQDGLIPLSHLFDTAGPMAKSPADLANLLDVLVTPKGSRKRKFHSQMMADDFRDFKIGFLSPDKWFFDSNLQRPVPEATAQIKKDTLAAYAKIALTAKAFKEVELVSIDTFEVNGRHSFYDIQAARFKPTFEAYLETLEYSQVRSLDELIRFNQNHAEKALPPSYDNQDQLQNAATMTMSDEEHDFLLRHARKVGRDIGIDKTLKEYDVDLVIAPGDSPVNLLVSAAGYPSATMPLSYLEYNGRPIGLVAFTTAGGEEMLLNFLRAYENTFPKRRAPSLL
ncbi:amidase domain-containing protein [Trichoderma breve]|uniref:Amidase domain-containing protein n=1 Tax=Trichoderma breve TaxID=2034170 RepID=A0A9W9B8C4_9HYPO|nr:amidase domain-containing protein [Trichoderma breve]KAJ4857834.1 amidase domain-containing protein [Trichoderma breve]